MVEARFDWAKQHLETLKGETEAYLGREPYSLEVEVNREATDYTFCIRVGEQPPDHWPLLISDIIHNLRSTLDNLAFNLAGSPAGRRAKDIQFPIVHPGKKGGRPAFDRAIPRTLSGVHDDAIAIIENVQPYHGLRGARPPVGSPAPWPPYPLTVLNYMSNIDKHRTPHIGFFAIEGVAMGSAITPQIETYSGRFLEDGTVVARYRFAQPNVKVNRPTATLVLALEIPWGRGRKSIELGLYLTLMVGLIEKDILTPLRSFMR